MLFFFFSSRRRHTRFDCDWSSDVCSSDVTGAPVKFVGLGEKYDALEGFYPERIVSRVLGMGDIMSLIERVEQTVDRKAAADLERKLRKEEFTLEDFRDQLKQIRKMGPLE